MSVCGYGYWEWTPGTGRWINPKYGVKDSASEQFLWAEQLREEGEIEKSVREHRKLLKHFPESEYAAESCFLLGEFFQERGEIKKAYDYFQRIVDNYQQSPRVIEAVKKQFELGREKMEASSFTLFRAGRRQKGDLLASAIEKHPYAEEAGEKSIMLGRFYLEIKEYGMARDIFLNAVENFPVGPAREEAHFYLIMAEYLSVPDVTTDIKALKRVSERVKSFLSSYPESEYLDRVKDINDKLLDSEAKKYFGIASYYERAGKRKAASYYYKMVADNYPGTDYGKIASEKISSAD